MTNLVALVDRFESKFVPEPNTGCWLWFAGGDSSGYGSFLLDGRSLGAHRVSYMIYIGDIPNNMHVLHKCDTRRCVNPDHLFLGTHKDNMEDRNNKNRQARLRGSFNGNSKLSAAQVLDIYARYNGKEFNTKSLSLEFGVDPSTIHLILKGRNWGHLTKHMLRGDMKEGNCP